MSSFTFKLLSGPHAGAEIEIEPGSFSIGSDLACDIVLSEPKLSPKHVIATVDDTGIAIESLAGELRHKRVAVESGKGPLPFHSLFEIGATRFTLGPAGQPWPDKIDAGGAETDDLDQERSVKKHNGRSQGANGRERRTKSKSPIFATALFATAGAILLAPAGIENKLAEIKAIDAIAPSSGDRSAAVQQLLERYKSARPEAIDLRLEAYRNGNEIVRGYVDSDERRTALAEDMQRIAPEIELEIFAADKVVTSVVNTLTALGRDLVVAYEGSGRIRLAGYIKDAGDLQRVVDILKRDVSGLRQIDNQVVTDRLIFDRLSASVDDAGLGEGVRMRLVDDRVVARGVIAENQVEAWREIETVFAETYGEYLRLASQVQIEQQVRAVAAPEPTITLPIVAARMGAVPYIILQDGSKHLIGSVVEDGWRIVRIEPGFVEFERDGRKVSQSI